MGLINTTEAVLLVGHGSKDADNVGEFRAFGELFCKSITPQPSGVCFLEYAEPSLAEEIERQVYNGAQKIKIVPLFLLAGGHIKQDFPEIMAVASRKFPGVEFTLASPIGVQPELVEILAERLAQATNPFAIAPEETSVLLVEAGSSDAEANSEVFKAARLLWEGGEYGWVEVGFTFVTRPSVAEGIDRCIRLGAKRVIVLPYFLFNGVLVKRIHSVIAQKCKQYGDIEISCAPHIGLHPRLLQIVLAKLAQLEVSFAH